MSRLRRLGVLLVVGLVLSVAGGTAAAHELQQDRGVSAVLHAYPDDNPPAGRPVYIALDYSSISRGFSVQDCACSLTTQTSSGETLTATVVSTKASTSQGHAIISFPEAGIYELTASGVTAKGSSQTFTLNYRLRVAAALAPSGNMTTSAKGLQVVFLSGISLILLGVATAEIIRRGGRYR